MVHLTTFNQGIILLEIAYWKPINNFKEMVPKHVEQWKMRDELQTRAKEDLPHMVGQNVADAIEACLLFREKTEGLDASQRHREYRSKIVERLERCAKCF